MDSLYVPLSVGLRMPNAGVLSLPALLQTSRPQTIALPKKARSGISYAKRSDVTSSHLRLPTFARYAQRPGRSRQRQNYLETNVKEGLACFKPSAPSTARQKARWPSGGISSQQTLGIGLYRNPGLERRTPKTGRDYRLRRQNDPCLEPKEAHDGRRHWRNAQRGGFPAFRSRQGKSSRDRIPFRQWIDLSVGAVQADAQVFRHDCLPHAHPKSRVQWDRGSVLWYTQKRLCVPKLFGNKRRYNTANTRLDQRLQRNRAAQRAQDDVTGQILLKLDFPKREISCLKLGGADQS